MRKDIQKIVEIPEGVNVDVVGQEFTVKSKGQEIKKKFNFQNITIAKDGNKIVLSAKKATKRELTAVGTVVAHLKNLIHGVQEDYEYKLEICNVHFPMTVKVEGNKVIIKTFLGEVNDRIAKIMPNSKVEVKGKDITVTSFDKDSAGQTSANIEKATKITGRDRRVFQDGIFITDKCGKAI